MHCVYALDLFNFSFKKCKKPHMTYKHCNYLIIMNKNECNREPKTTKGKWHQPLLDGSTNTCLTCLIMFNMFIHGLNAMFSRCSMHTIDAWTDFKSNIAHNCVQIYNHCTNHICKDPSTFSTSTTKSFYLIMLGIIALRHAHLSL